MGAADRADLASAAPVAASNPRPRFPLFDSLRAIAALAVFGVHLPFAIKLAEENVLRPYLLKLDVGVSIFFVISGFLLYRPFAHARATGEPAPAAGPYAWRRALRLVPAYWVALPFVVLLVGPSGEGSTAVPVFSPQGVVSYFGFLQVYSPETLLGGISAAWTLCAEAAFYLLLPVWAYGLRRVPVRSEGSFVRTELLALGGLWAAGWAWTLVAAARTTVSPAVFTDVTQLDPALYVLPTFLDHFAIGMALAVTSVAVAGRERRPRAVQLVERAPWVPWLVALLAFGALGQVAGWFAGSFGRGFAVSHALQSLVAASIVLPAVFGGATQRGWIRKLLARRVLLWIGLVSYSLYLWHAQIILALVNADATKDLPAPLFVALALGLSLAVAGLSFHLVERPALRLGRRRGGGAGWRAQDADARARDLARHA